MAVPSVIPSEDLFFRKPSDPQVDAFEANRFELAERLGVRHPELLSASIEERAASAQTSFPADAVYDDALSALTNLGYQRNAAEKALKQSVQEGTEMSVQKLLRRSLQRLAKG